MNRLLIADFRRLIGELVDAIAIQEACEAGNSIKPGVERSGTPGSSVEKYMEPAERATAA